MLLPLLMMSAAGFFGGAASAPPPLYNITATSLYDAGLQHGQLAADRIKGWLRSDEMSKIVAFTKGSGRMVFEQLKNQSAERYPQYVDEIRGIAHGSGVALDSVWALNMIAELEALMSMKTSGHCSDIYAVSEGKFSHGHNEDWPGIVKDYFYFVKYTAGPGAEFGSCAGLVYPGAIVGWAPTWNSHGMYFTQNSLFPVNNTPRGVAGIFAQREAMCGKGGNKDQDAVVSEAIRFPWSSGASLNVIDLKTGSMANIEVHEGEYSVHQVSNNTLITANYSHFNMYKHLKPGVLDRPEASTLHRQARVDELASPKTTRDIITRLSDTADTNWPIFRNMTLTTMVLDGSAARMDVWCCGHTAASAPPTYTWDLLHFFEEDSDSLLVI